MNKLKKVFANNKILLKAFTMLVSGSLIGTLITAIQQVLQTHIFSAEAIGTYTYLLAIPLMFIGVTSLRYDVAIVVEKDDHNALALVKVSFLCSIIVAVLVTLFYTIYILFIDKDYISYWYAIPLVFVMLMGYGINNILNSYNNRERNYKMISQTYVIRTLAQRGGVIILGLLFVTLLKLDELSVFIMIFCYSVGLFFAIAKQSKSLREHSKEIKDVTRAEMKEVIKFHKRQPLYATPALFVNSFSYSSISIIMENIYDSVTLGYYSVSTRVLGLPISLVSGNISKVYLENATVEYKNTGKFVNAFKKTFLLLIIMAIPMFLGMYFLAPFFCRILFGEGWEVAGEYIKILALMYSLRLIGNALPPSLAICNKQKVDLIFQIGLAVASILSGLVIVITQAKVETFLTLLCLTRSLCYVIVIICVYIYSKGEKKNEN